MLTNIIFIIAFNVIIVVLGIVRPGPEYQPTQGEVWPKPQHQTKSILYYKLRPSAFKFMITSHKCEILSSAIERYRKVLWSMYGQAWRHLRQNWQLGQIEITDHPYRGIIKKLQINVSEPCEDYPQLKMDEMYWLHISTISTLSSNSIWGALNGLETFIQLFYMSNDYKAVFINSTYIEDYPSYPHRGLLIDTSRHYITVPNILKTLDAMEMNKMNVLHWHIVDDQSFPYQSEKFPQLSAQGAYHETMVYTKENIKLIVNYARDRGIRVLPEFDIPAHTRSWGLAYPDILTECYEENREIGLGPMNPVSNMTYKLIHELFKEVRQLFPEEYFHIGGDEVDYNCWQSNTEVMNFVTRHEIRYIPQLHAYFTHRVFTLLGDSKPIVWQEVFEKGVKLTNDTIVQVWKSEDAETLGRILKAGHKVIYSASWYLDHLKSGGDWLDFYNADPRKIVRNFNVNLNDILGGEACVWGEVIDDRNILSRVWPRASAVAERLWNDDVETTQKFLSPPKIVFQRIEEHTCRMNRRGIDAQPPNGPGFCVLD